jgi:4-amino-4-deoxy-L-arabinose transferase-like glycosyltransferase
MKLFHSRTALLLFGTGILVRLFFFVFGLLKMPIAVDESLVGVMAMHILKGEFPVVYWGQTYMGTQESFIDAPLIWLFGANAFSIRIFPFVFSALFVFFIYKLACRVYNNNIGSITLLLLAVPIPYLSIASAVVQPDTYISTCVFGTIGLLLTYDLVFTDSKRRNAKYFGLGFVLGFALWMHLLVVSYIGVCVVFLFLKDKLFIFRKGFWIFAIGFILGGLPLLWYNVIHHGATFRDVGFTTNIPGSIANLKILFTCTLHYLVGLKIMLCADVYYTMELPRLLYWSTGVVVIIVILIAIAAQFKHFWRICLFSIKKVNGTALLITMAAASIFIFCRSGRSFWKEVRYILPLMSVLPIFYAQGLYTIKNYSRKVFYGFISVIILAQGWGNIMLVNAIIDSDLVAEQLDLQDMSPVINFLKQHKIKHAYANYCFSYNLMYLTNEEIICTNPYNERFLDYEVPFISEVRVSHNVAYVFHKRIGIKAGDFEREIQLIGGKYKKQELGSYTVFYDFKPPYEGNVLKEILRNKWEVESNFKNEDVKYAIDGDIDTRWGSGERQSPGMFFKVDMGRECEINGIKFDLGKFTNDFPRGYTVEVSSDNMHWEKVSNMPQTTALFWEGSHPRYIGNGRYFNVAFSPVKARYVKITQTGSDQRFDWSIAEINIYG